MKGRNQDKQTKKQKKQNKINKLNLEETDHVGRRKL